MVPLLTKIIPSWRKFLHNRQNIYPLRQCIVSFKPQLPVVIGNSNLLPRNPSEAWRSVFPALASPTKTDRSNLSFEKIP